ncbi:MAG TPA: site-2 protease family protein [Actinobacteria bacterium]|nr:site-2 protease family protein [Actinomycetes bacterium]HEX21178.1 site-2 protease family protein [Actinomycetota bacterium]
MTKIIGYLLIIPALVISVTFHEFMHGFVSSRLGDPTPKQAGRLTLNPLRHLDLLGSIMIFLVNFGWGKPMPINPTYYKNPRRGTMYVSLAGPLSNFFIAGVTVLIMRAANFTTAGFLSTSLYYLAVISVFLGVFNLIPVPPLDGSKILAAFMPRNLLPAYYSMERYGIAIIFIGFYFFRWDRYLTPLVNVFFKAFGLPLY